MMRAAAVKSWYLIHRWTSLVSTAFLLVACLTGLPLVFEDELSDWLTPHVHPASAMPGTPPASVDAMVAAAQRVYPALRPYAVGYDDDEPRVLVTLTATENPRSASEFHQVIFDQFTGIELERPKAGASPMISILELHRSLFLGLPGEAIMAVVAACFLASLVSGTVLYAPFMRNLRFGTYRTTGSPRLRWFDLHNLVGIVTLTWLLVVGATGLMNALATPLFGFWRMQAMPALLKPYHGRNTPAHLTSIDLAMQAAAKALPDMEVVSVLFPNATVSSPLHYVVWMKGKTAVTSRLMTPALIDCETGALTAARPLPWYLRTLEISRPLHFGDYGGMPLKVLWGGFDMAAIVVLVSGIYLWAKKRDPFREDPVASQLCPAQKADI